MEHKESLETDHCIYGILSLGKYDITKQKNKLISRWYFEKPLMTWKKCEAVFLSPSIYKKNFM